MDEEEEWPEAWDRNKVYMYTDPDGNKVPVPYGFTVSGAESEKYVNHNVEKRGTLEELTWTSSGDYPWTKNESNVWINGNEDTLNSESELISNEITVGANGGYLNIELSISSYDSTTLSNSNYMSITITNTITGISKTPRIICGRNFIKKYFNNYSNVTYNDLEYLKYSQELEEGKYIFSVKFIINNLTYSNSKNNFGYVKKGTILNYDETGADKAIIHKTGGLVIYEGLELVNENSYNRNQFVWIPVAEPNRIYSINSNTGKKKAKLYEYRYSLTQRSNSDYDTRLEPGIAPLTSSTTTSYDNIKHFSKYDMLGYTKDTFYKELQNEFDKTMTSIEKYGGFYIGRFETTKVENALVVNGNGNPIIFQTWYTMYNNAQNISNNKNIQTSIIWGCLWDETLKWLIESGDKTLAEVYLDATPWGDYNSIFDYSENPKKANNIYGLAGGKVDWTLERTSENSFFRSHRGHMFSSFSTALSAMTPLYRGSTMPYNQGVSYPDSKNGSISCRLFFYIK